MERKKPSAVQTVRKLLGFLGRRQKAQFAAVLVILLVSAVLAQLTPLAVEYLTNTVLAAQTIRLGAVMPVLLAILAANVTNEVIKVVRRLLVEDTDEGEEIRARIVQRGGFSLLVPAAGHLPGYAPGNFEVKKNAARGQRSFLF